LTRPKGVLYRKADIGALKGIKFGYTRFTATIKPANSGLYSVMGGLTPPLRKFWSVSN